MADLAAAAAPPAAPDINARPPQAVLDPQLFMAARCGDSGRLKELLLLRNDGDQQGAPAAATATTTAQVTLEVDPSPAAAPLLHLLDGVTGNEGDSLLHVVAACGDGENFLHCTKMIYQGRSGLLVARNNRGDTPLHCAAGAGNASMISCIVGLAAAGAETRTVTEFLRMWNKCGETALHQAVRAGSTASMDELMSVDPELAAVPSEADEGNTTSPLYLAISLGKEDIAEHLIQRSNGKLSCSGPDGRNALHAAVTRRKVLPMLLELFKDVMIQVQQGEGARPARTVPLLSQLTMQRDIDGSTPLHLAASLDWWPEAWIVSERFKHIWPWSKSIATLLLDANICSAYQPDNKGLYPIHIAALADNLDVTKVLLQRCPDCATLRDGEGRTFLHVATLPGTDWFFQNKVACYASRQPKLSLVLNVQDNNGDTALHHAVRVGNLEVFNCLVRNPKLDLSIPNKDDLTPLDLSRSKIPYQSISYKSNPRVVMSRTLLLVGAPAGGSRSDLFREKYIIGKIDEKKVSEYLVNTTQAMGIVSVLIATVTFASAFTLPGGYYQSASDGGVPGTPILARSYAFHAFILADTLAFICSCLATFSLVFAGVPAVDHFIRLKHSNISMRLLFASEISLMASFALGLYLVLAPTAHAIAITVCAISSGAFLFGSMDEAMHMLYDLNTPRARLGIRRLLSTWCDFVPAKCISALIPLIPLIVIFGLPAIIGNPDKTLSSLKVILWKEDIAGFILVSLLIVGWVLPRIRLRVRRWKL
ncbi:hypothetical protein PVAP13_8KG350916 [Panicum virgatum]|uniref:PGG domain-containing protein n=1 Tax=Panicum virgatum TaxID=38727 RepID=A0A8T0PQS3_PANVG|nr:hypothetical protein PVAP13_8KG350916 [Panicum virgatum]